MRKIFGLVGCAKKLLNLDISSISFEYSTTAFVVLGTSPSSKCVVQLLPAVTDKKSPVTPTDYKDVWVVFPDIFLDISVEKATSFAKTFHGRFFVF
jgi:hypothetical protein